MHEKFLAHIKENFPLLLEKPFCVAVSGGIDSMVLADLLLKSKISFTILHCNFGLRAAASDADTDFVKAYAQAHDIPFRAAHFDTKKYASEKQISTQMAARELRYNWFAEALPVLKADYLATAHHADDSLETFLINLSRGTGIEGLLGIPAVNGKTVRPLLIFSREEIERYAAENNIQWREDASNATDDYLRNRIRHSIVPQLKETNADFLSNFQETLRHLQQSKSMAEDASGMVFSEVAQQTINGSYHFDIAQLEKLPNRNAYLFHWLSGFGFTAWEDIYRLVWAQSGKQVFSASHVLLKDRDKLILSVRKEPSQSWTIDKKSPQVNFPLKFAFSGVDAISQADSNCIFVDEGKLQFPLTVRRWEEGDYFYPLGMQGKKKLSKYFKDEKIPLSEKPEIWLLCSGDQIIWVVGRRPDERFKVTNHTTKILQICANP